MKRRCVVAATVAAALTGATAGTAAAPPVPSGSLAICNSVGNYAPGCYRLDLPSRKLTRLTRNGLDTALAWSRDGRRIALIHDAERDSGGLYVMNADGSDLKRVGRVDAETASWGPNDEMLVVRVNKGIAVVRPDGTGLRIIRSFGSSPSWSPDGRSIVFVDGSPNRIMRMNPDGSGAHPILVAKLFPGVGIEYLARPAWSPDGKHLAYFSWRSDREDRIALKVRDAAGGRPRTVATLTGTFSGLSWSPDSRSIAVADLPDPQGGVYLVPAAGGRARLLYGGPNAFWTFPIWAPAP